MVYYSQRGDLDFSLDAVALKWAAVIRNVICDDDTLKYNIIVIFWQWKCYDKVIWKYKNERWKWWEQ